MNNTLMHNIMTTNKPTNKPTNKSMNRRLAILWLATVVSAVAVVTVRHQNRLAFIAWRNAEADKVELQSEHGRLILEKATWAGRRNIVDDARRRLGMAAPAPDKIITLIPQRGH